MLGRRENKIDGVFMYVGVQLSGVVFVRAHHASVLGFIVFLIVA
jgi:hypothetical protein